MINMEIFEVLLYNLCIHSISAIQIMNTGTDIFTCHTFVTFVLTFNILGKGCLFPVAWHGEYFHLGYSQPLTILNSTISGKGRCVENLGSQYIMEDKEEYGEKCWRCMTIFRKHHNVLQYRESKNYYPILAFPCPIFLCSSNLSVMQAPQLAWCFASTRGQFSRGFFFNNL